MGRSRAGEGQIGATVQGPSFVPQRRRSLFHCLFSRWVKATSVPRGEIALLQRLAVELRHGAPGTVCPGTGWGIGEHRAPCPLATISTTGACQHRTLK